MPWYVHQNQVSVRSLDIFVNSILYSSAIKSAATTRAPFGPNPYFSIKFPTSTQLRISTWTLAHSSHLILQTLQWQRLALTFLAVHRMRLWEAISLTPQFLWWKQLASSFPTYISVCEGRIIFLYLLKCWWLRLDGFQVCLARVFRGSHSYCSYHNRWDSCNDKQG